MQLVQRDQVKLGLDNGQLAKEIVAIQHSNELLDVRRKKLDDLAKVTALLSTERIQSLNIDVSTALNDNATGKLDINQLQRTIEALAHDADLRIPLQIVLDAKSKEDIRKELGTIQAISKPFAIKAEDLGVKEALTKINTELALADLKPLDIQVNTEKATKDIDDLNNSINTAIQQAATAAAVSLGETIGTALAGGDVQSMFEDFISILSAGLKEIGKAMISFATTRIILANISKINPYVALAAGIGLVAAGAALQSSISKRKFADGCIISSPQDIRVGEAGPEVVFPLTNLNSVLGRITGNRSNDSGFLASTSISGDDLNILINRSIRRSGGSFDKNPYTR